MRTFREKLHDIENDPSEWEAVSAHSERSTRAGGRKHGSSTQTIYKNKLTGETVVRHTVRDDGGRVIDDQFRPGYSLARETPTMQSKQSIASALQNELQMFVLDVLRHDTVEQVPSIVRLLNDGSGCIGWREFWPHDFSTSEVVSALIALERDGDAAAWREGSADDDLVPVPASQLDSSACGEAWFGLTDGGRRRLDKWEPPIS